MILKQIEVNRQEKLLKDEMREQENMMMVGHLEKLQKEDYEELKKRKEKQKLLAVRHSLIGLWILFLYDSQISDKILESIIKVFENHIFFS